MMTVMDKFEKKPAMFMTSFDGSPTFQVFHGSSYVILMRFFVQIPLRDLSKTFFILRQCFLLSLGNGTDRILVLYFE